MAIWREDVLKDEFQCTEIDLGEDTEGPVVATLVRALPEPLGFWDRLRKRRRMLEDVDVLYVHGWSDYFFQKPIARFFTSRGARFYALDLRKYGRSLREWQTPGAIDDLQKYDEEINAARAIMRESGEGHEPEKPRRLVLLGHSTGGLVLTLWADRHNGEADAVVLNSPWLELQLSSMGRKALAPVVNVTARFRHTDKALPQVDLGFYSQAQQAFCSEDEWAAINHDWRPELTMPVHAAWLNAILDGHSKIEEGIDVGAPVCVLLSARSQFGLAWDEGMMYADTVLEVEGISHAALKLGASVTVDRIEGALHDVFLSDKQPRAVAYDHMDRWLRGWLAATE